MMIRCRSYRTLNWERIGAAARRQESLERLHRFIAEKAAARGINLAETSENKIQNERN